MCKIVLFNSSTRFIGGGVSPQAMPDEFDFYANRDRTDWTILHVLSLVPKHYRNQDFLCGKFRVPKKAIANYCNALASIDLLERQQHPITQRVSYDVTAQGIKWMEEMMERWAEMGGNAEMAETEKLKDQAKRRGLDWNRDLSKDTLKSLQEAKKKEQEEWNRRT